MSLFTLKSTSHPVNLTRPSRSSRQFHLARTADILHLSLQRGDLSRAKRAWSILVRCREFEWKTQWKLGLVVLGDDEGEKMAYLQKAFLACPDEKEPILKEIVLSYISQHRERAALDQLELYLHSFPFQDNPPLHTYAGMLSLYLAQAGDVFAGSAMDHNLLRTAKSHFLTTLNLDPNNPAALAYQELINTLPKFEGERIWDASDEESESAS